MSSGSFHLSEPHYTSLVAGHDVTTYVHSSDATIGSTFSAVNYEHGLMKSVKVVVIGIIEPHLYVITRSE